MITEHSKNEVEYKESSGHFFFKKKKEEKSRSSLIKWMLFTAGNRMESCLGSAPESRQLVIPSTMSSNKYIYKAILLFPVCKEQAN